MADTQFIVWPQGDLVDGSTARTVSAHGPRAAALMYFCSLPFDIKKPLLVIEPGEDPEHARRFTFTVVERS